MVKIPAKQVSGLQIADATLSAIAALPDASVGLIEKTGADTVGLVAINPLGRILNNSSLTEINALLGAIVDTNADAAIAAMGLTSATQRIAVINAIARFKANGTWSKHVAIYAIVGGNATAHAVNLKNPGTNNLTFNGSWTHTASGMAGDGASGTFADTGLALSGFNRQNIHLSCYLRTVPSEAAGAIGFDFPSPNSAYIFPRNLSNQLILQAGGDDLIVAAPTVGGHLLINSSAANYAGYRNGASTSSSTVPPSSNFTTSGTIKLARIDAGSTSSTAEFAFVTVGLGLTAAEIAADYATVQAFQSDLGRQVGTATPNPIDTPGVVLSPFSAAVPFRRNCAFATQTITGPITFTIAPGMKVPGVEVIYRLIADGNPINNPNISAFKVINTDTGFDGRAGILNILKFIFDGVDHWVEIWQEKGALPTYNTIGLTFPTRAGNTITNSGNIYTPASSAASFDAFMSSAQAIPQNKAGRITVKVADVAMVALCDTAIAESYLSNNLDYFAWNASGFAYSGYQGTPVVNGGISMTNPGWLRLTRSSQGVVTAECSNNGVNWFLYRTFTTTTLVPLWVTCNLSGQGQKTLEVVSFEVEP